ncbi:MAG: hypothetical protein KBG15_19700 [Kofleriaceae bacterium]|nr:hypothetical protein [Kofleriaceae bacterium]
MVSIKQGTMIALTAASLFASACKKDGAKPNPAPTAADKVANPAPTAADNGSAAPTAAEKVAKKIHCGGINECKGKSLCAAAKSSCAGQNACKGQGWIDATEADCKAKGGTQVAGMDNMK